MASKGVNRVTLVGNLGANPELRTIPGGDSVVNLSLATGDYYIDKAGERKETTEWHKVSFWGKPAEAIAKYCRKGSSLYVEGSLHTRKYQDKNDGSDRWVTEIRGREFVFLSKSEAGGKGSSDKGSGGAGKPANPPADNDGHDENIPY